MFAKLKLWGAAFTAFLLAVLSARYYQKKSARLKRQIVKNKVIAKNQKAQLHAIKKHQENNQREIDDALKDDSYMDYFDPE